MWTLTDLALSQLLLFSNWIDLKKQEFLWEKGDEGLMFYFMVTGNAELIVKSSDTGEFKYSKGADLNTFFGYKELKEPRVDFARMVTDKCEILSFNTNMLKEIVAKTQLSTAEKKLEFLIRYVPKIRNVNRKVIEDFEVFF